MQILLLCYVALGAENRTILLTKIQPHGQNQRHLSSPLMNMPKKTSLPKLGKDIKSLAGRFLQLKRSSISNPTFPNDKNKTIFHSLLTVAEEISQ